MPEPATGTEFLVLLKQSQLLAPKIFQKIQMSVADLGDAVSTARKLAATLVKSGVVTTWQARRLLAGRKSGFYIGKYKLLELLGAGGMGQVYLAEQLTMQRLVAIKLIRSMANKKKRAEVVQRFTREARAVAALRHPNIVQAFDFDEESGRPYMVMEYIEGIDAARHVDKFGALPPEQAADYIAQAAAGLQHAHEQGLVHRDVKPGNMHVDREGHVKMLDLGLVSALSSSTDDSLTVQQDQLGSVDYVAPEQALDSRNVDARADIYGLGASLYVLLAAKIMFPGKTPTEKLLAQQTKDATPIQEHVSDLPDGLAEVVSRMTKKDPGERYQSMKEVVAALEPFAKRKTPPYDLSVIRHTTESLDKFLRRSPEPSELEASPADESVASELAGEGKPVKKPKSGTDLATQDSFLGEAMSSDHFNWDVGSDEFGPPVTAARLPSKKKKKRTAKKKKKSASSISLPLIIGGCAAGVVAVIGLILAMRGGADAVPVNITQTNSESTQSGADGGNSASPEQTRTTNNSGERKRNPEFASLTPSNRDTSSGGGLQLARESFEFGLGGEAMPWKTEHSGDANAKLVPAPDGEALRLECREPDSNIIVRWDLGEMRKFEPFEVSIDFRPNTKRVGADIVAVSSWKKPLFKVSTNPGKRSFQVTTVKDQELTGQVVPGQYSPGEWYRFHIRAFFKGKKPWPYYSVVITARGKNNALETMFYDGSAVEEFPRLRQSNMKWVQTRSRSTQAGSSFDIDNVSFTVLSKP